MDSRLTEGLSLLTIKVPISVTAESIILSEPESSKWSVSISVVVPKAFAQSVESETLTAIETKVIRSRGQSQAYREEDY